MAQGTKHAEQGARQGAEQKEQQQQRQGGSQLDCKLDFYTWAPIFGLPTRVRSSDVCKAVSRVMPPLVRKNIVITKVVNRGGYGIVFLARGRSKARRQGHRKEVAVKVQFVCPKKVKDWRDRCGAYGQRPLLYDTVRYETRMHKLVYNAVEAARRVPSNEHRLIPAIPEFISGSKVLLGKTGEFPTVPPDGRRRLWVSLTEFVKGKSLRQVVLDAEDSHTLTGQLLESLCKSILLFLVEFHALGFTHGDTHASNIMLDEDKAARGEPWMYLIDLERCIPTEYFTHHDSHPEEHKLFVMDMLRLWDLKVFCESVAALAETANVGGGAEPEPWSAHPGSVPSPESPAMAQYLRCSQFILRLIGYYMKRDVSREEWAVSISKVWAVRTLYLKRSISMKTVPTSIKKDVGGIDVERQDAMQKNNFFITLRKVQKFYTS
jgi:serine/threonine protein kinase